MEQQLNQFELFAIVELFGHSRIAGNVTEQNVAGANMVRVDVPETEKQPAFTRFFNPQAIYAINPVSEEVMQYTAAQIQAKPIEAWDIRKMMEKTLELQQQNP